MIDRRPVRRDGSGPEAAGLSTERIARWLVGLRLVAVSALLVGALLVQSTTDEILPIGPLARVAGLTYLLSLAWIGLWVARVPPRVQSTLQLGGDIAIVATLVYLTGGLWSPFPFLFLVPVGVAALVFGLRGALATAGAAFAAYGAMVAAMGYRLIPPPGSFSQVPSLGTPGPVFQLAVTGVGFALVALLTSYLAHSLQQAESQLRGAHLATARLMALSTDVVRSVDSGVMATDPEGRVVLANPAALRILGVTDHVEGSPLADVLPLVGVEWAQLMARTATHHVVRAEGALPPSGRPVGLTVTPLSGEVGGPLGFVVHFRDLSEAREQARRERLRERLAAVGEMAAGMAHEIRNPLASISGSAQVLAGTPALRESDRRLMHIIVEESRRLSGIIEAFLGYARPPEPTRGPCDIARVLTETLDLFANSAEVTPSHRLERAIEPLPSPIVANEGQLRQAFFNLARNAVQAMPQGGTMRIQAAVAGGNYAIRWSDEGVGMTAQQIDEIFQPFKAFRQGGTGLGLAVVYSIVTDHGGDIHVESAPGRGCTFTLRIPVEPP
jgi:two-component system, NtrC family, sensor histidine kinase PilS